MIYNFIIRYPFSNKAKEFMISKDINLFDIDEKIIKRATVFLLKTIPQNYSNHESQWNNYKKMDDLRLAELFVKLYPISKILVFLVDNISLTQSFANYYEKQLKFYLLNPLDNSELEIVIEDLCPKLNYNLDDYSIPLIDLLNLDLGDDYKLEYSNLEKGDIYLTKNEVIDLLSVILKKRLLRNKDVDKDTLPSMFLDYASFISDKLVELDTYSNYKNITFDKPDPKDYPPCFKKIFNNLVAGKQLRHFENYHLAVFLFNIGFDYNSMLDLYRNTPNFDEKIAGYQIKKIIEKEYSVASCQTIKSNGFCVNECKVKHPLQLLSKNVKNKNVENND
jgi:DNA primase large subunit